jgi:hypothetical protein
MQAICNPDPKLPMRRRQLGRAAMLSFLLGLLAQPSTASSLKQPRPTRAQVKAMDAKLRAMGLPPHLESLAREPSTIREVTLAPVFAEPFACSEHAEGQLDRAGDALGTDCIIVGGLQGDGGFERMYRTDGSENADWYGWHAEVRAPVSGIIKFVYINPATNKPGTMGRPPASMIEIERADGTNVVLAHIVDARVSIGDAVKAGDVIALVGNNGMARNPHIHLGAFKGRLPMQIRWDLRAMGNMPAHRGE